MNTQLIARVSITIRASVAHVWKALVTPAAIKAYMFGTTVTSEWVVGSPIVWTGEWQGRAYEDKGIHFVSARRLRALRIRRPRAERAVITCRVRTPSCSWGGRDDQERAAREGTERPGQGSTHRRARPPRSARLVLPGRHGRHREDRQGRPGAEDCCQSRQEEVDPLASRPPAMSLYLQPDVELTAEDGSLLLSRRGVPVAHVLGGG